MVESENNKQVRRAIFAAIREHLAQSAPFDAVHDEHHVEHKTNPPIVSSVVNEQTASPVERFRDALSSVAGHCLIVNDETEAANVVLEILGKINARRVAISDSRLVGRVMERVKTDAEVLLKASKSELFDCDAGITSAQWAAAETGTLVLESDAERHRLGSLIPPVHIALIEADKIRQTLGEVLESLSEQGRERLSRTVTFITGPSRTSDIELTLAIGVHGPGELFAIILNTVTT